VFERFTEDARKAVGFAQGWCRAVASRQVQAEHIALAVLWEPSPVVEGILARMSVVAADLGGRIERASALSCPHRVEPVPGDLSLFYPVFSRRARRLFEMAERFADQHQQAQIGQEHLLVGAAGAGGVVEEVLGALDGLERAVEMASRARTRADRDGLARIRVPLAVGRAKVVGGLGRLPGHLPVGGHGTRRLRVVEGGSVGLEPFCSGCSQPLASGARWRRVAVDPTDPMGERVEVDVVYCGSCGTALGYLGSAEGGAVREPSA
jgi:hypothetical protein